MPAIRIRARRRHVPRDGGDGRRPAKGREQQRSFYNIGTVKVTRVGKELTLFAFDENDFSLGNGLLDHMTWHCWGTASFVNGVGAPRGSCVGMDPAGDQISFDFEHEKWSSLDQKIVHGSAKFTVGTGKFAGISGGFTYVGHNDLRTAVEGTYAFHADFQGGYKLP